jgi:hypothetical protein
MRFTRRWRSLRGEQLLREDLRDLTRVQELDRITVLAELLTRQAGQLVNYTTLANRIDVSVDTIRRLLLLRDPPLVPERGQVAPETAEDLPLGLGSGARWRR